MADEMKKWAEETVQQIQRNNGHGCPDQAQAIREAIQLTRKKCADIASGYRMVGPSPIGPLHGAGWNDVVAHIVKALEPEKP